jgi:CRISPR type IV-associated protein Csf3
MQPLRIEFRLASPITEPVYPIHLDALAAWSAVEAAKAKGDPEPLLAQGNLPFAREAGVWCASALQLESVDAPFTVAQTKRTDLLKFSDALCNGPLKKARNKLDTTRGPWRQSLYFTQCRQVSTAKAWCMGDRDRLEELLSRIDYLGALRRIGRGRITALEIVDDPRAAQRWRERLLAEPAEGFIPMHGVSSPPYWDRRRAATVWAHPNIV